MAGRLRGPVSDREQDENHKEDKEDDDTIFFRLHRATLIS
jgi:hypothetical protein